MKIVLASGIYPPDAGGPATYTRALARALVAAGHQVHIVCYADCRETSPDDPCAITRISRTRVLPLRYAAFFRAVLREAKNADMVYAQGSDVAGFPATIAARIARKPTAIKVVGDYAWETYAGTGGQELLDTFLMHRHVGKVRILEFIERWTSKQARQIIVPSAYLKTVVAAWGVPEHRIQVVYNAIPPLPEGRTREEVRTNLGLNEKRVLLTAIRAVPWKGGDFLIRQLKTLPENVLLAIAGDGPSLPQWKHVAAQEGLMDRVRFLGRIDRATLADWYRAADLFVLASGYEGLPFAVVEAASVGLPSFVSDKGGNPETRALVAPVPVRVLPYQDTDAWHAALISPWPTRGVAAERVSPFDQMIQETGDLLTRVTQPPIRVIMLSYERGFLDKASHASTRLAQYASDDLRISVVVLPKAQTNGVEERGAMRILRQTGGTMRRLWGGFALAWKEVAHARRAGERPVLSAQDPFIGGILAFLISRCRNTPYEIQEHADYFSGAWERERVSHRLFAALGRGIMRRADHVRTVSDRVRRRIALFGISPERMSVIPVAMDISTLLMHRARSWPHVPTILVPCRFVKQKGLDILLESLAELAQEGIPFHLRLVGEGPEGPHLAEHALRLGIRDQVTFEPWGNAATLWSNADLFVLSSHYEGWGRTIVEAMAAGIPIVTTDVGCVGSFFRPGVAGLVVPPGNVPALAAAIRGQLTDAAHRTQMAAQAREQARTFPSVETLVAEQCAAWQAAVAAPSNPARSTRARTAWKWTLAIVAFAALIRLASFVWFGDTLGANREWGFFTLVQHWFEGYGYSFVGEPGNPSAYRSPGFLFFLTAVYGLFGFANFTAQAAIQNILAVVLVYLVYRLGLRVTGDRRVGWVAALLVAVHPYTFYHYTQYYHSVLSGLFLVSLVLSLLALDRTRRFRWAAWVGVMTAALAYVQGTILIAMPFLAAWILWRWRTEFRRAVLAIAIIAIISAGLIAPWTIRNWQAFHAFVPLTTDLGLAFYKANTENYERLLIAGYPHEALEEETHPSDPTRVRYHYLPEVRAMLEATGGIKDAAFWTMWHPREPGNVDVTEAEYNAYWMHLAREWIAAHPTDFARLALRKAVIFWQPALHPSIKYGAAWSFGNDSMIAFIARWSLTAYVAILELLALIGLFIVIRRKQLGTIAPLLIILIAYTAMHMLFVPYTKYRIPLDHFIGVFSGAAVVFGWDLWKRKKGHNTCPYIRKR